MGLSVRRYSAPAMNSTPTLQYQTCYSARATVPDIGPGPVLLQYSSYSIGACYSTAGPALFNSAHSRLGCHIHPHLGLDVLVEASNQLTHTGQEHDLLSWLTTVCPSANQHMYTSVRPVLTAHP